MKTGKTKKTGRRANATKQTWADEEVAEIAEKARQWVMSDEGQTAIAEGLRQAEEMCRQFREAQRIKDWRILFQPMTI